MISRRRVARRIPHQGAVIRDAWRGTPGRLTRSRAQHFGPLPWAAALAVAAAVQAAGCTITVSIDHAPGAAACLAISGCGAAGAASAPAVGSSASGIIERLHSLKDAPR